MSEETIRLFNGELLISKNKMPNLYKIITSMGVYEAECYIYNTASKMLFLGKPTNDKLQEVMQMIEDDQIQPTDNGVLPLL